MPSSSLVKLEIEVEVGVQVEVEAGAGVEVGIIQLRSTDKVKFYFSGWVG